MRYLEHFSTGWHLHLVFVHILAAPERAVEIYDRIRDNVSHELPARVSYLFIFASTPGVSNKHLWGFCDAVHDFLTSNDLYDESA